MLNKYINTGTKIEIRAKHSNSRTYLSQVENIKDDKNIRIFSPIFEGRIVPLSVNARYDIIFMNETGCYFCSSIVRKRGKKETFSYVDLEITSRLEKFQRRNYFRFKCMLDMKYIIVNSNEEDLIENFSDIRFGIDADKNSMAAYAVVRDISGGGLRFISNNYLKRGERIQTFIDLKIANIPTIAEVISTESINNEFYKYEHRAKFIVILEKDREKIIRYIFDEQRRILRKENGL